MCRALPLHARALVFSHLYKNLSHQWIVHLFSRQRKKNHDAKDWRSEKNLATVWISVTVSKYHGNAPPRQKIAQEVCSRIVEKCYRIPERMPSSSVGEITSRNQVNDRYGLSSGLPYWPIMHVFNDFDYTARIFQPDCIKHRV